MNIIFTKPTDGYEAGILYEVPEEKAQEYINQDIAMEINNNYFPTIEADNVEKNNNKKRKK